MVGFIIRREENETWRQAVERYAKPWGLEEECLEFFDADVARGEPEDKAAWGACYEWDVLGLVVTEESNETIV